MRLPGRLRSRLDTIPLSGHNQAVTNGAGHVAAHRTFTFSKKFQGGVPGRGKVEKVEKLGGAARDRTSFV